jgi:hypothetical protein
MAIVANAIIASVIGGLVADALIVRLRVGEV